MRNFLKFLENGLSIEETRVSSLILALFFCLGLGAYSLFCYGDFPVNVTELLKILILSVAGVNVADRINLGIKEKEKK